MNEQRLREELRRRPLPGEREAEERAWEIVRAAYESRALARPRPRRGRLTLALAAALVAAALLALTPAGATVGDWISDVFEPGRERARPALTSLPAPGRLLVVSGEGPWIVQRDGSKRLLGSYDDATWSPSGLFVAVTRGRQLIAVDPVGDVRWSLARPQAVTDPRWAPSGFRIAYLTGDSLRVVAGDGTGDRLLAERVARVPPVWKPIEQAHVVAYADRTGRIRVVNTDRRASIATAPVGPTPIALDWSASGKRLLVASRSSVRILSAAGEPIGTLRMPPGSRVQAAAFAPAGSSLALIRTRRSADPAKPVRSEVVLVRERGGALRERRPSLYSGPGRFTGLAWAPGGSRLLVAWRDADQWLFIPPRERGRVTAVGNISRQFAPGAEGKASFPTVAGWCCPRD